MNKNDFERAIVGDVPLHEAADFFVKLKYAGWEDPPDETLEGQTASSLEEIGAASAEVAAFKFKLMVAYHVYGESMKALAQHAVGEMFREHAEQERAAAEFYLKRASVLSNGPVQLEAIETPPALSEPEQILSTMIRAEQEGIAGQRNLRAMIGEEHPMRFEVERILTEDLHHLDELRQLSADQTPAPLPTTKPEPSQSIKIDTSSPQGQEPQQEEASAQEPATEPAKLAVSNQWAAKRVIHGLDSRAARAGMKPKGSAVGRAAKLEHAMGAGGAKGQSEVVKHLKGKVLPGITRAAGKHEAKKKTIKTVAGVAAGATAVGAAAHAIKKHKEKNASASGYSKGVAHGAMTGFGIGAGGTAVALDRAHAWADKRRAQESSKSASQVIDSLLAADMPEGKFGHNKLAMRMKLAAVKIAAAATEMPPSQDDGQTTPVANETPAEAPPSPRPSPEPIPGDYVANELNALVAQNANEAAYYRGQVESSQQQTEQLQQQIQQMQEQLSQIQNQSAVAGVQVQALTSQATEANDRALQYSSETANMRMGTQKMREALLQLASQDPAAMGSLSEMGQQQQADEETEMAQQQAPADGGEPGKQANPAAAAPGTPENTSAPGGGTPPGAAGAGEGGVTDSQPEAKSKGPSGGADDTAKTQISIKNASALPWMAGGGILGALDGVLGEKRRMKDLPNMHKRVEELEAAESEGSTFEQAVALARAKADLEQAKLTNKYPDRAMTRSALQQGKTGIMLGSSLHGGLNDLGEAWKEFKR